MSTLQVLFQTIAQCPNELTLQPHIQTATAYFAAQRGRLFFLDQLPFVEPGLQSVLRVALSIEHNPVVRYLVERHAPVHEALVVSPRTWRMICPREDHWHVMAWPIVAKGQLIGAVGFTRSRGMPAFDAQNLADLSALCLHLSTWAVTVRSFKPEVQPQHKATKPLTHREMQIVELVAQGQTNAEIGAALWITENSVKQALKRIFRKLQVSSRTEMVAVLAIDSNFSGFTRSSNLHVSGAIGISTQNSLPSPTVE